MDLLKPAAQLAASKRLFGTAYRMSASDVSVVGHQSMQGSPGATRARSGNQ